MIMHCYASSDNNNNHTSLISFLKPLAIVQINQTVRTKAGGVKIRGHAIKVYDSHTTTRLWR
jgi:hypothetical protein